MASRLLLVLFNDTFDLLVNIRESIVANIRNLMFDAIFLKMEAFPCEEHISFASCGKVGDSISNEDNQRNLVV